MIKVWGDDFAENTLEQAKQTSEMPFVFKHLALMPDAHFGLGATVGTVVATKGAIIPAAVGVDIGCGMLAVKTSLIANDLPDSLASLRFKLEAQIPVGFAQYQGYNGMMADKFHKTLTVLLTTHPDIDKHSKDSLYIKCSKQMGTLGGGNHFIEICLDTNQDVWIMLHSGSRGMGNLIGRYFIAKAQRDMERWFINLPNKDLAYIPEGSTLFNDYCDAVALAQEYAFKNRQSMLCKIIRVMQDEFKDFHLTEEAINCHHNYIAQENHFGHNVWVTRKGAVRARIGDLGIIPGSMGTKSFIVEGLGNRDSFFSCSHGAGRVMSRKEAKRVLTIDDHIKATEGVECRKDKDMIDESPAAYKDIDKVMDAQKDLVKIKYTLKQVLCIKG